MFYVPIKLREWKSYCVPRGPNFARARTVASQINGIHIEFKLPPHRARSSYVKLNLKKKYNTETLYGFSPYYGSNPGWLGVLLMNRVWDFYGDFFLGRMGFVECAIKLYCQSKKGENGDKTSYFHPRVFELALSDFIGDKFNDIFRGEQIWFAPQNWKPLKASVMPLVRFDVTVNKKWQPFEDDNYCVAFPVSDHHIIMLEFRFSRNVQYIGDKPQLNLDEWVSRKPMDELINNVINSLTITPSEQVLGKIREAQAGLSDPSLVKEFAPVNVFEHEKAKGIERDEWGKIIEKNRYE